MNGKPVDNQQRIMALDPERSFICEAPAGSGKTELLTQRVLTLLARVDNPESILAITFTRKAAAEMRDRILAALIAGTGVEPEDEHGKNTWKLAQAVLQLDQTKNWNLLRNPNRLQIRTFDSLCAMLTQTLPIQSSLGANIGIGSDTDALYIEAVTELLKLMESDVPWAHALSNLLAHLDNKYARVEELLVKLLRSRDAWMPIVNIADSEQEVKATLERHLQSAINDKQAQLLSLLSNELVQRLLEMGSFAASNLLLHGVESPITELKNAELELLDYSQITSEQWLAVVALVLTKSGEWRKRLDKNCGFPPGNDKAEKAFFKLKKEQMLCLIEELASAPNALELLQGIEYWPASTYKPEQWHFLRSLTQILPVLVAQLQIVFRAHGEVDFLEMSTRALQALGTEDQPTDLVLRLDHRIQHILADEFQDTSFTQVGLLQKLTAGWQQGDGRTLFCVGDAMQSIYGFRGANVGLFLNCKARGLGSVVFHPLQLTTNFRSQAGVVNWINATFKQAFPNENDISTGAVMYSKAHAFRGQLQTPAITKNLYSKELGPSFEAENIVQQVEQIHRDSPKSTTAILVRTKNHAKYIVHALKEKKIRFRAVDLESLADQSVIQDLMSLTQAILYPEDRIAWFSILRSPWCGLTLADLEVIAKQISYSDGELVFVQMQHCLSTPNAALSGDGRQRIARVLPTLTKAFAERNRKPLRQWIEGLWLQLGGAACLTDLGDSENAERFFQCLEELSAEGKSPSKEVLIKNVNALFAAPDPEADERLQIMTIHKSKGLEFDEVILPGLHRKPRNQDTELLLWQERLSLNGDDEWLLAVINATGETKDPIYRYLERERAVKEKFEACRLLYVACTRAKKHLHLFAQVQPVDGEHKVYKPPVSTSLLASIWSSVANAVDSQFFEAEKSEEPKEQEQRLERVPTPFVRLPCHWQLPKLPELFLLKDYIVHADFDNRSAVEEVITLSSSLPRYVGTLIHQILQVMGEQGLASWRSQDLTCKVPFWHSRLIALGATEGEADIALPSVLACIQTMIASERFNWLMSGDCKFEYPLSSYDKSEVSTSIIDLLMVDEHGQAWVVDYKTSCPSAEEDLKGFVAKEVANYQKQLDHYRYLIHQLGYDVVKCALFFVTIDHWVEC